MRVINSVKSAIRPLYSAVVNQPAISEIRKSRPVFSRLRKRYFAEHPIKIKRDATDPALAELLANGVVVLPRYFDRAKIEQIHNKALPLAELVRQGEALMEWNTVSYASDGIYRLYGI